MNILILGATGRTGEELTKQALAAGHKITAIVRTPSKVTISNPNLQVVAGDVFSTQDLSRELKGKDAVISTLGPKNINDTIIEQMTKALLPALKNSSCKRVIMLSSQFASQDYPVSLIQKPVVLIMSMILKDKIKAEKLLKQSDLDWTIVYATALTNGEYNKRYQVEYSLPKGLRILGTISRSNVADYILKTLNDPSTIRKSPVISSI